MRAIPRSKNKPGILFPLLILLILNACAPVGVSEPTEPRQPTPLIPQTGPTMEEPTAEATEVEIVERPPRISLTAVKFAAKVFKGGDAETEVKQDQKVDVEAADRIEVVKLENQVEQSRSILDFSDFLEVELFTNAVVLLEDVRQESGGSTHVTLNLSRGHVFLELNDETTSRVTVETPDSIINTLEDGTEFNVCKAPDKLTCVGVTKGAVELITLGKREILKAEEARFIFKDELPSPAICAPNEIFLEWKERYRQSVNAPTLSSMVAGLQEPCSWQTLELPPGARSLYQDQFTNSLSGWLQEKKDNHFIGYSTPEYYHIQIQSPGESTVVNLPGRSKYGDVNIDLKAFTGSAKSGDFQYGVVFRQSGDQYYGFAVSPNTKKWSVLKSSSDGLAVLKEGENDGIQDSDAENVLRVLAKGSLFTFYVNSQLVYQLLDGDYARGEVGLFVQTVDSPSALIYFDSLVVWDKPTNLQNPAPLKKENCFNNKDDDGDRFVDRDDPDCNTPDLIVFITPTPELAVPPDPVTACSPPEEDPQCPESNPYDPTICDCGDFIPGGCTDPTATNYDPDAPYDDGSCEYPQDVYGCTDPNATNYDPNATIDDGSCQYPPQDVYGCTDPNATNYDPNATIDDGSCQYPPQDVYGCTDPNATNYDPNATIDDGSCTYG